MDANSSAIENCEISGNHASAGGGLVINGEEPATVTGNSIWGNSAQNGGGIYNSELDNQFIQPLTNDEITGNYASADGGGIDNQGSGYPGGSLNLTHARISGNHAGSLGGGIYSAGALAAAHSTISGNSARGVAASTRRTRVPAMTSR